MQTAVLSSTYSKALFTMSYLVSFQLKKVLNCMGEEGEPKSGRGLAPKAIIKFNSFFKQNLVKLLVEEANRDALCPEALNAPKFSVCFTDLAEYLNLKDDVLAKLAEIESERMQESYMSYSRPMRTPLVPQDESIIEDPRNE